MGRWVEPEIRDDVVATIEKSSRRAQWPLRRLIDLAGIGQGRFYDWRNRRGQPNHHNVSTPKKGQLLESEKEAIKAYYAEHQGEGCHRLAWKMIDEDVAFASPATVWRTLKQARLLADSTAKDSKKGTGFVQPEKPHEHWHSDISYLNIHGTFYYFSGLLDGASRFIVHWEIRESMLESYLELLIQKALELYPNVHPRIISDNGPQYIARDFREFIRLGGMTHVRTAPYYPQSNGKIERFHGSLKRECIRPRTPCSLEDARRIVAEYVWQYNHVRLHSAIGYVAPVVVLEGRQEAVFAERRRKIDTAQKRREDIRNLTAKEGKEIVAKAGKTETGSAGAQPDQGIAARDTDEKSGVWLEGQPPAQPAADFSEVLAHA